MNEKSSTPFMLIVTIVIGIALFLGYRNFGFIKEKFLGKKAIVFETVQAQDLGRVVARVGSKVLREQELEERLFAIFQAYPQLRGAMDIKKIPYGFKETVVKKWIDETLILGWAEDEKVGQSLEFKKAFEEAKEKIRRLLLLQEFEKRTLREIEATDKEIRDEYEKNKQKYLKTPGGMKVSGVRFDKREDAETFLAKLKGKLAEFGTMAKEEDAGTFRNFGRINNESMVMPSEVKDLALKAKKYPSLQIVMAEDKAWVVYLEGKVQDEHFAFDEIKGQIETFLRSRKFQDLYQQKLEARRKKLSPEIREEVLKAEEPPAEAAKQEKETTQEGRQMPEGAAAL